MAIFPFLSHGSHNDRNDLAHFKASSLPPQIFSSHVWFIIPFHTLSVSCQRRALFWKVQEKDTDGKSVNFSSNINISQRYFICHLQQASQTSHFCQYTVSARQHIYLFSSNNPAHRYYLSSDPVTGQLYVSDTNSRRIYRPRVLSGDVEPQANVEVVAGTGDHCLPFDENQCGDGGPASEALLTGPKGT